MLLKVKQLTSEQVHHLVKMTRDFTLLFYKVFYFSPLVDCFLLDLRYFYFCFFQNSVERMDPHFTSITRCINVQTVASVAELSPSVDWETTVE